MARIVTIETKDEERSLRRKAKLFSFSEFSTHQIDELLREMRTAMKQANGIGLSANQIGYDLQVFVAQVPDQNGHMKFYSVFNPFLDEVAKEKVDMEEGCLSVPGLYGIVERPERLTLLGQDKRGKKIKLKAWGLLARIIQHEVDHLNGALFIDKARNVHNAVEESDEPAKSQNH